MHCVRAAVSFLLLAGCVEREPLPPAKRDPWPAPATAGTATTSSEPRALAPGLQLVSVPDAVTHDVSASLLIIVHADGTVVSMPRKEVGPLTPDVLAAATPTDPTAIGQRGHVYLAQSETLAARASAGVPRCDDPIPEAGPRSGFGTGNGRSVAAPAGLRGDALAADAQCHEHTPLVIVDARAPAARLVEVLEALDYATIGVTSDDGKQVRTLALGLAFRAGNQPGAADPQEVPLVIRPAGPDPTIDVAGKRPRVRLDGDVSSATLLTAIADLLAGKVAGVAFGDATDFVPRPRVVPPGPQAFLQPTVVEGTYEKAIVRRFLKRNLPKLSYCYEKQLLSTPALQGSLSLAFAIQPDGKLTGVKATGVNATVASCVAGVVKTIELPASTDGQASKAQQVIDYAPTGG